MIYSEKYLGLLLFTGFIALNHAKLLNPTYWLMFAKSDRHLNPRSLRGKLKESQTSDLVVFGSHEFKTKNWHERKTVSPSSTEGDETENNECELEVVNNLNEPVLLCWVTDKGELRHYHPIFDKSIRDGSVTNNHLEYTHVNHCFVCIKQTTILPKFLRDIKDDNFLFIFSSSAKRTKSVLTLSSQKKRLWSKATVLQVDHQVLPLSHANSDIISSVDKVYLTRTMHGFTVHYEPDVFECTPNLEETLNRDLCMVNRLLPPAARDKLQKDTHMWINKAITYGTVSAPVQGTSCTYHPLGGRDWLRKNGLNENKEGSVEFFAAGCFLESRGYWGDGGVILHEYCHAYHNKFCPDGFDCEEIRQAYNVAMERKLYDKCAVHGPQGTTGSAKAYACANCMEFWAELSVAYHWTADDTTEYNKWFPFNRAQFIAHDKDNFEVFEKYWHILDSEGDNVEGTRGIIKGVEKDNKEKDVDENVESISGK